MNSTKESTTEFDDPGAFVYLGEVETNPGSVAVLRHPNGSIIMDVRVPKEQTGLTNAGQTLASAGLNRGEVIALATLLSQAANLEIRPL